MRPSPQYQGERDEKTVWKKRKDEYIPNPTVVKPSGGDPGVWYTFAMDFSTYQEESKKTAIYPDWGNNFVYPALGLASEAGEVAGKLKKVVRDKGGVLDDETRREVSKELGDVLWYVAQLASEMSVSLDTLASENIHKLQSRQSRGKLGGDGDNR
jgi:NTP pyrophosphatase (non-canonical NTP hydrolase)